ncbi:MAG: FUSC family protein [Porticoccaceae bacterium]|nr:FUSC family protein [Porticoccaceae bacterium]
MLRFYHSRLWEHIKPLLVLSDKKRSWGFLVLAALSVGLPVFVGAALGHFSSAIIASMGGLVILYMQQTPIVRRMRILLACSFGFLLSFSLGTLTSFNPYFSAITLAATVFVVTWACRFYSIPPPGSFFFILVACMSRTLPFDLTLVAERAGILLFGCLGACLLVLIYSVAQVLLRGQEPAQPSPPKDHRIAAIILESAVISLFVGGGYLVALMIPLDNPYWVPISTAAIMQGATFRAVWHRNVHRIVGTFIGMGLAWAIFSLSPNVWILAGLIMLLSFVIEVLITRNYGLAVIFITPLTVIFADSAIASMDTERLILARLIDIMLGSFIGYLGGWVIHHPKFFYYLERRMVNR